MLKLLFLLFVALVLEAIGVVYLSKGIKELGDLPQFTLIEIGRIAWRGLTNSNIWIGLALETVFFVLLLILLHGWDVSLIWPLTSLGFLITVLAAKCIRHEEVSALRWGGVCLIVLGATLVGYSERMKKSPATSPPTSASSSLHSP